MRLLTSRQIKIIFVNILLSVVVLFAFQNCLNLNGTGKTDSAQNNGGNGSGYDGKLYFGNFAGNCGTETSITVGTFDNDQVLMPQNVIEVSDDKKTAYQVVKNCEVLNPPIAVDVTTLLPYNDNLIFPADELFESIASPTAGLAYQDTTELACRLSDFTIRPTNCNFQNCTQDTSFAIDTQLSPVLSVKRDESGLVLTALRKVKVNIGLFQTASRFNDSPIAIIKNALGSISEKPVQKFNPLAYFDSFIPTMFLLNRGTHPEVSVSLDGQYNGELNIYESYIQTDEFSGKIEFSLSVINQNQDVYDSSNIYMTWLKVSFDASKYFSGNEFAEYKPYVKCNIQ